MCDDITESENGHWLLGRTIGRRELGAMGAGAAVLAMMPAVPWRKMDRRCHKHSDGQRGWRRRRDDGRVFRAILSAASIRP